MKTKPTIFFCLFFACFFFVTFLSGQSKALPVVEKMLLENKSQGKALLAASDLCPADPCPCKNGYKEIKLYYFGEDNVTVNAHTKKTLNNLIISFPNVQSGDLLSISGAGLPNGYLSTYTYLEVVDGGGDVCVTDIYTSCPKNVWPQAVKELQIVGKTFGDFTVFSVTDDETSFECDLSHAQQDWRVGGNVVAAENNTLGTLNDENMTFISNNTPRGVLLANGNFGLGTLTPTARLEVQGDVRISETLDVDGITTIHNTTASSNAANGALVVAGGAGIAENLNVGQNLDVEGTATIGSDLTVEENGLTTLENDAQSSATNNGALVVAGGVGIARNINIGENLTVEAGGLTRLQNNTPATSPNTGALVVSGGAGIGNNLHVGQNLEVLQNAFVSGRLNVGTMEMPSPLGGVSTANYHLFVAGGILTEEVLVRTGWADYVFEKDYLLRSLPATEAYIEAHGHLPDMPAAREVETGGLPLAANAVNQQVKIEEIFLHLIEMNKQMEALKAENQALRKMVSEIRQK